MSMFILIKNISGNQFENNQHFVIFKSQLMGNVQLYEYYLKCLEGLRRISVVFMCVLEKKINSNRS